MASGSVSGLSGESFNSSTVPDAAFCNREWGE